MNSNRFQRLLSVVAITVILQSAASSAFALDSVCGVGGVSGGPSTTGYTIAKTTYLELLLEGELLAELHTERNFSGTWYPVQDIGGDKLKNSAGFISITLVYDGGVNGGTYRSNGKAIFVFLNPGWSDTCNGSTYTYSS